MDTLSIVYLYLVYGLTSINIRSRLNLKTSNVLIFILTLLVFLTIGCNNTISQNDTKPKCPICNLKKDVIPIIYGLPDDALFKKGQKGEVKLGGCVVMDDAPQWYCKKCEKEF